MKLLVHHPFPDDTPVRSEAAGIQGFLVSNRPENDDQQNKQYQNESNAATKCRYSATNATCVSHGYLLLSVRDTVLYAEQLPEDWTLAG
ncbi:hypothetical protein [Gorillibacterium massiliense]|uniref:hypothetical protein n=1 Tax=Gorillibacterium massiliense TaxID=1280390 RepID=UPI0012DCA2F8|nr:hypothetical protein [Gorillibacterium massiliense]